MENKMFSKKLANNKKLNLFLTDMSQLVALSLLIFLHLFYSSFYLFLTRIFTPLRVVEHIVLNKENCIKCTTNY